MLLYNNSFKTLPKIQKCRIYRKGPASTTGDGLKRSTSSSYKVPPFLSLGLRIYGKNWKKIEQLVESRSGSQIRSHAQKFFLKGKTEEGTQESNMCQFSGDFAEEPESITGNSKSVGEGIYKKDDLSYFLTRM